MANISRKQVGVIAIPLVVIAVLLPVALIIATRNDEGRNETAQPVESPLVPGAGANATPPAGAQTVVDMVDISFSPNELEVDEGSTVAFLNRDITRHRVRIDGTDYDSGNLESGESSTWTATGSGEHSFVCEIHPNQMQGTITVRAR